MGGYKEVDALNKEFQKAQKNWNKINLKIDQQKIQYHRICQEMDQNDSRAKQESRICIYIYMYIYSEYLEYLHNSDMLTICLHYFLLYLNNFNLI